MTRYRLVADNAEQVASRIVGGTISDRTLYLICVSMRTTPTGVNKQFMDAIFTSEEGCKQAWKRKFARRLTRLPVTPRVYGAILVASPSDFMKHVIRNLDPHHLASPQEALELVGMSVEDPKERDKSPTIRLLSPTRSRPQKNQRQRK